MEVSIQRREGERGTYETVWVCEYYGRVIGSSEVRTGGESQDLCRSIMKEAAELGIPCRVTYEGILICSGAIDTDAHLQGAAEANPRVAR